MTPSVVSERVVPLVPDDSGDPLRGRATAALICVVAAGAGARAAQYLSRQSYRHDEAFIVMNVLDRTARELLSGGLDYSQAAPPLFLLMERASLGLGASEFSLRLGPLLLGVGSVVFMALLARRLLPPVGAVLATGLLAFSDKLIWHAAEAKQYSGDVFVSAFLLYVALVPRRPVSTAMRLALLAGMSAVLLWFSFTAVFVFGGISLALLRRVVGRRGGGRRLVGIVGYVAANLPVALSFGLLYWFSIRHQRDDYLDTYWREFFVDWRAPWMLPWWLARQTFKLFAHPYRPFGAMLLGLAVLGVWRSRRDDRAIPPGMSASAPSASFSRQACSPLESPPLESAQPLTFPTAVLLAPILLNVLAAAAGQYPFGGSRVTMYLIVPAFLLAGAGVGRLAPALPLRWRRWWWTPAAAALAFGFGQAIVRLPLPRTDSNIRPVAEYVAARFRPGDTIYAFDDAGLQGRSYQFQCYWRRRSPVENIWPADAAPLPAGRIWLTYAYAPGRGLRRAEPMLARLRASADPIDRFDVPGGAAFLFEKRVGGNE